ncbi:hypothetical protein [Zoogloea sp.]|uniref:hypothetical protein n=1 Tax=Zoogloea sp. TaxID=49181 RepID=UPI0035B3EB78
MPATHRSPLRRGLAALLLACGLTAAGGSHASDERRYEGLLLPEDFSPPISVSIELRDLQGLLVGEFKGESPYSGNGRVTSGEMNGSKCDFHVQTGGGTTLHLAGSCTATLFEGKYRQADRREASARGTFRLASKPVTSDEDKADAARKARPPLPSVTECINANTRCLVSCPQSDPDEAFLCASLCRSRFKTCKTRSALR